MINDQDELDYIDTNFGRPRWILGYYAEKDGDNRIYNAWSLEWVNES